MSMRGRPSARPAGAPTLVEVRWGRLTLIVVVVVSVALVAVTALESGNGSGTAVATSSTGRPAAVRGALHAAVGAAVAPLRAGRPRRLRGRRPRQVEPPGTGRSAADGRHQGGQPGRPRRHRPPLPPRRRLPRRPLHRARRNPAPGCCRAAGGGDQLRRHPAAGRRGPGGRGGAVAQGRRLSRHPDGGRPGPAGCRDAEQPHRRLGPRLPAAGVTIDLAPVADTVPPSFAGSNPPIGGYDRQYGSTPYAVAADLATVVTALQSTGLLATVKHFPGARAGAREHRHVHRRGGQSDHSGRSVP